MLKRQKRGVIWPHLLELLLALLVLVGLLYMFFPGFAQKSKELFGEMVGVIRPESMQRVEFKPYEPKLTSEEKNIDDSINGLICAINSIAIGRPAWETKQCPGTYEVVVKQPEIKGKVTEPAAVAGACSGASYGKVCVECDSSGRFKCNIKNFELPQGIKDQAYADQWISGTGDPKYLVYYESFPQGEQSYWNLDVFSFQPTVLVIAAGANLVFPLGTDVKKLISGGNVKQALADFYQNTLTYKAYNGFANGVRAIKSLLKASKSKQSLDRTMLAVEDLLGDSSIPLLDSNKHEFTIDVLSRHVRDGQIVDELGLKSDIKSFFFDQELKKPGVIAYINSLDGVHPLKEVLRQADNSIFVESKTIQILDSIKKSLSADVTEEASEKLAAKRKLAALLDSVVESSGKVNSARLKELLGNANTNLEHLDKIITDGSLTKEQARLIVSKIEQLAADYPKDRALYLKGKTLSNVADDLLGSADPQQSQKAFQLWDKISNALGTGTFGTTKLAEWSIRAGIKGTQTVQEHKFATIMALGFAGYISDSQDSKFQYHGKDSFVVSTPLAIEKPLTYSLDAASKYNIVLQDNTRENTRRFYLASPCKADLELTSLNAVSSIGGNFDLTKIDLYDFGGGIIPVTKGSLVHPIAQQQAPARLPEAESLIAEATKSFNNEDYTEALAKAEEVIEKYPNSYSVGEAVNLIDSILQNREIISRIPFDKLKELAFVERVPAEMRAEYYGPYFVMEKRARDPKFSGLFYGDRGCDTKGEYMSNLRSCDNKLLSLPGQASDSSFIPLLFSLDKSLYGTRLQLKDGFQINEYDFRLRTLYSQIDSSYRDSLYYIFRKGNAAFSDAAMSATEESTWKSYYSYSRFALGNALFPKHLALMSLNFFGVESGFALAPEDYLKIVGRYNEIESSTDLQALSSQELLNEKQYYEYKNSIGTLPPGALIKAVVSDSLSNEDLNKWVSINKALQLKGAVDASKAVKQFGDDFKSGHDPAKFFNGKHFSYPVIQITPHLEKYPDYNGGKSSDRNYCFHSGSFLRDTSQYSILVASVALDKVAGIAAGTACAPVTGGLFAVVCAKAAMSTVDAGLAYLGHEVNQGDKWPQHK